MSNEPVRKRQPSEVLKRGYSDEEIANIYELGRLSLENGNLRRAEAIMNGLIEVAPDFACAWLGMAYIHIQNRDFEAALQATRQALKIDPHFNEALLYLVACLLTTGDYSSAGTYLGELGELIESGGLDDPGMVRFYRTQMARYQNR
ncbi:MAG: tetratricopeptide repeat protein [Deltaproteobacteria bacterium]|nr:tetratricopeptide repeat protein [Deltaproteobacteria bacterium]